ncbi:MAG: hypothetical protein JNM43_08385 [Planctomycetaceae bacterium]|nr:hypothetical protein [Planctomycetaceae bacterium]
MSPGCPDRKTQMAVPSLQVSPMDRVVTMLSVSLIGASGFLACMVVAWLSDFQAARNTTPPPEVGAIVASGEETLIPQSGQIESPDETDVMASANEQAISFLPAELLAEAGLAIPTALTIDDVTEEPESTRRGLPSETEGSGKRPIGGGGRRVSRTWQIELGSDSLAEYQRQLGQLQIDVSAKSSDGTVVTLHFDEAGKMTVSRRPVQQAANDQRFVMVVENTGNPLGRADEALFQQAGVAIEGAEFVHYLSNEAEQHLERLERAAAGQNDVRNILRTEFSVRPADGRYEFFVTEQIIR